jgi:hypothetical protein
MEDEKFINIEIPTFDEFLGYAKTLNNYHSKLDFSIKEKYDSFKNNDWKNSADRPIINWKSLLEKQLPFLKILDEEITNNKFKEWGKLGGRPQKENKKSERITLRFTPDEMNILKKESERKDISLTDYSRIILLNKTVPDVEKNLQLIEYANNFSRLTNFIRSGIFNAEEKKYFLEELEATMKGIRNSINWE